MKCMNEGTLLAFLDNELSTKEKNQIQNHINQCDECAGMLESLQQRKENLMALMNDNIANDCVVPPFEPQSAAYFTPDNKSQFQKVVFYVVAAAILVMLLLVLKPEKSNDFIIYTYDLTCEFDANLPITKQEMTIHIYSNNDLSKNP